MVNYLSRPLMQLSFLSAQCAEKAYSLLYTSHIVVRMSSQVFGAARTYAFVGFIFYVLSTIAELIGALAIMFFFVTSISTSIPPSPPTTIITFPFFGLISLAVFLLFIPGIILTVLAWTTVRNIDVGRYGQARTYSLILGIIGLFFGMLIGGIFFLLAYAKLGESVIQPAAIPPKPQRFCVKCGRAVPLDAQFCPHCGKELPP
jgi:hypothetical protein